MKIGKTLLFSLLPLLVGLLLMQFLRRVYVAGLIIFFVLVAFQTPNPKRDQTGEVNDANIQILKFIGLNVIMYLVGGYLALLVF